MRISWKSEWPHWMLLLAMFGLAAWRWPLTGDHNPVHWNASGQVDRYGGRFEGLLLVPLMALGIYALCALLPRFDPGQANYAQFAKPFNAVRLAVLSCMAVVYSATLLATAGHDETSRIVPGAVGILFIVLGGAMGKIRPNWFVGMRTPWTLSSKTAWIKTQRVGGWTFTILGAMFIGVGVGVAAPNDALAIIMVVVLTLAAPLVLSVYSYLVWRDANDKVPPADTLPDVD